METLADQLYELKANLRKVESQRDAYRLACHAQGVKLAEIEKILLDYAEADAIMLARFDDETLTDIANVLRKVK